MTLHVFKGFVPAAGAQFFFPPFFLSYYDTASAWGLGRCALVTAVQVAEAQAAATVAAEGRGSNQKDDESRHAATSRWVQSGDGILCGCGMGVSFSRRFQPAERNRLTKGVQRMQRVDQHRVSLDATQARKRRIRAKTLKSERND